MTRKVATDRFVAALCRESYYQFFLEFWSIVSAEKLKPAWYIKRLCDELQALSERVFLGQPREYDLIWNCPPGTTKPVWDQSLIIMADGSWKKLVDISIGEQVINKLGKPTTVEEIHEQGSLPCVSIRTQSGREIVAALDHPILTADGWVEAGSIVPGQMLALMHHPELESCTDRTTDEFILAGYFIGDGSITDNNCSLTSADPDYYKHFVICANRIGFDHSIRIKRSKSTNVDLVCIALRSRPGSSGPRAWLEDVGMAGMSSYTKKIPDFVWHGSNAQVSEFLASYFHCDGCVSYRDKGKRNILISMTTVSKELAFGLQKLFLRFGINMKIRRHVNKKGFKHNRKLVGYVTYRVEATDQDTAVRFMDKIPIRGRKKTKLEDFKPQKRTFEQEYWPDEVISMETIGDRKCRCLTVKHGSSFCVEGIVVHNSSTVSVLWQPWVWTRFPSARFISGSHSERLSLDLSRKSRDVVMSDKYRTLFPDITLREDQNTKGYFVNTKGGFRYATGVGGSVIGMHAHFLCVDDPIDPLGAISELELAEANTWMTETLSRRKVDAMLTPTVIIMQRLHQNDPTGNHLELGTPTCHFMVPCDTSWEIQPPDLVDHYQDGLLDSTRLPRAALDEAMKALGETAYAGQYGQSPVPRGGAQFKVDRLLYEKYPPTQWKRGPVRYWDKAATRKGGAFTVGTKVGLDWRDQVWILDVVRGQWDTGTRETKILDVAKVDGKQIKIGIEQEPAGSGKSDAEATMKRLILAGFRVKLDKAQVDKELRANPLSVYVNQGLVIMVIAYWNKVFVDEMRFFPMSKYKDQIDSASGAFNMLTGPRYRIGSL